ncbi:MAG: histidine--tRNA ligase [Firmicutes bacterium]|nr:histidine--tRNA ligase [Bacillota bacterium]
MLTGAPRGTRDILPDEARAWRQVEAAAREIAGLYGFGEIRTPIFEHTELFQRGVGEGTDIVQKEMYTFADRGDRSITLRAEGTAPAARAYVEHSLYAGPQPVKLYYLAPIFRYERPQAGRLRQHHQFGIEIFGAAEPAADVEILALAYHLFDRLGIRRPRLALNSVGCADCRGSYREKLLAYYGPRKDKLCPDCRDRYERNPMRLLDCKREDCREAAAGAPVIAESLCPECRAHLDGVVFGLESAGIPHELDPFIVRGLDYYNRTAFEFLADDLGAQKAVGAGGRYDGLVQACGGPSTPGVGCGIGLERLLLLREKHAADAAHAASDSASTPRSKAGSNAGTVDGRSGVSDGRAGTASPGAAAGEIGREGSLYLAVVGSAALGTAPALARELRDHGTAVEYDLLGRSLKAQLRYADKKGFRQVVILGDDELKANLAVVKDLGEGTQRQVPLASLREHLASGSKTPV